MERTKPISYLNKDKHALEKLISAMMSIHNFPDFLTTVILHSTRWYSETEGYFLSSFSLHINPDLSITNVRKYDS